MNKRYMVKDSRSDKIIEGPFATPIGARNRAEQLNATGYPRRFRVCEDTDQTIPDDKDCTCYLDCREDSHSRRWHQHEGEECPVHVCAPMVG